jgi:pyrimidine-nucleoside phosphorylase/thymidine phosphorylase
MRPQDLIEKKRDGHELSRHEIALLIRGYTRDEIPDYQMAAWLMAVFLNGMTEEEMQALVEEMLYSGEVLSHSDIPAPKVDKHSTGGVGDKTSLVVGPVAAACGVVVPMISGRALAHTGGTLDKLESIPGFRTDLHLTDFRGMLKKYGLSFIGQTREIAPADRKLYSLRDLTGTVQSIPLICASIMSKKLAEGIDGLVLDVKTGSGAFMRSEEMARKLAVALVSVGKRMGKNVVALITDMDQPLGRRIGNAVETREAIEMLQGKLTGDFAELSIELAAHMLLVGGVARDLDSARSSAVEAITSHRALELFRSVIMAQGGDGGVVDDPSRMKQAKRVKAIGAQRGGFVTGIATDEIGRMIMDWGGGRRRLGDPIDHSVGFEIHAKPGDRVETGAPLLTAFYNDEHRFEEMQQRVHKAFQIGEAAAHEGRLIREVLH